MEPERFEAVVIGTGFGGAVTACRLVEAGFRICVLERGRRYGADDFPQYAGDGLFVHEDAGDAHGEPPPDFSRWLWGRDFGIYDIVDLGDAMAVQASGYGGGSLIYANVHLRPPRDVFAHGWPAEYVPGDAAWPLTQYFDLAAYMLDASPIPVRLAKTMQMMRTAEALRDEDGPLAFRLPLAVAFDKSGPPDPRPPADPDSFVNRFARTQKPCDMRGRCWLGCDRHAKNTLDLNYLARAEDDRDHPADVRTLSEVTAIDRLARGGFRVTYTDLIPRGGNATHWIEADYVFLCAGAIGTTRLLFCNPNLIRNTPSRDGPLGSRYFTNAGSLAAVFDCERPHEADYGPTITAALHYDAAIPDAHVLDFSQHAAHAGPATGVDVVGRTSKARARLVREPILDWGAWKDGTATGCLVVTTPSVPFEDGEVLCLGGTACAVARSSSVPQRHWFMVQDGGYPPDMEPLAGLFRSPLWARRNRFLEVEGVLPSYAPPGRQLRVQAFADAMTGIPTADLLETQIRRLSPPWLTKALDENREELIAAAGAAFLPLLSRLLDELSLALADQINADVLKRVDVEFIGGVKKEMLVRGMLRQALQVLAGSEVTLANKAAEVFTTGLPLRPEQVLQAAGRVALWALAYGTGGRHTGVVLTLGRDIHRGRLDFTPAHGAQPGVLRARLPENASRQHALLQERVLRTIARDQWKGELRTNPAWAALGTHITVHSQGGCPMGSDPAHSVTNPWGEVHGSEGLFVMDAAAFPTSVGVNPSATIAAVAELKIEHFIRSRLDDPAWRARDMPAALAWADERRDALDPLGRITGARREPRVERLGLEFREGMRGFSSAHHDNGGVTWEGLELDPSAKAWEHFSDAEEEGMRQRRTVVAHLKLAVADLAELVAGRPTTEPVRIAVSGTVGLSDGRSQTPRWFRAAGEGSYVQFFAAARPAPQSAPPPSPATETLARFFRYELDLIDGADLRYRLSGRKVLCNERGGGIWNDTATLFFELHGPGVRERGILRLSLPEFARYQLPSMTVTGTIDPARRSWALAAFAKYFAGGLSEVYVTRADRLIELLFKSVTTIHV